jgi:hypothetical protein
MLNWDSVNEYGPNLVNFIRDVRLDLESPNLPFSKSNQQENEIRDCQITLIDLLFVSHR